MSKVASITISARPKSANYDLSPTSPKPDAGIESEAKRPGMTSSDSEEDKHMRRKGSSSGSSPERRLSSQRRYESYDQERGLIHSGRSGKMSARQRTLERELRTEDPTTITSSDDALASSDDGLEDAFIPRKSSDSYYMVKEKNVNDEGGNIYQKKNIEPPRAKSQPAGNRVQSATGKLLDNYVKDQSFDNLSDGDIEKPKTSVSVLKAAYAKKTVENKPLERYKVNEELEHIRNTMQNRGMMERDESGGEEKAPEQEVMYRKPLSSIKDRFFAAASGRRVRSSSESEEEDGTEGKQKEEIIGAAQRVVDIKSQWREKGRWEDKIKEFDEYIMTPSQSVFEMKKQWLESNPRPHDEVPKEAAIHPEQRVVDMRKYWQQPFTINSRQDNKEELITLDQSVSEIKQKWPIEQVFDEENKENMELIVRPCMPVFEMTEKWQKGVMGMEEDQNLTNTGKFQGDIDAREDIDTAQVGNARSAFKEMEHRQDAISTTNKPRVSKIADPNSIMEARRHKTYGDESQVDGVIRHEGQDELASLEMDVDQIKAAKDRFKMIERSGDQEKKQLRRPSMKIIRQEDVDKTMIAHRKKVSAEDFDDYAEHTKPNGSATGHLTNGSDRQ